MDTNTEQALVEWVRQARLYTKQNSQAKVGHRSTAFP